MSDNPGDEGLGLQETVLFPVDISTPALIDGVWNYTWHEQTFDTATGLYEDSPTGRFGTGMVELNNNLVATPMYVWGRFKGIIAGLPVYEFDSGQPLGGSSSSSGSATVEVMTDAECDSGGLFNTFKALTGTVTIGGVTYTVKFNLE